METYISIEKINNRKNCLSNVNDYHPELYPLFSNYNEGYNYENLRDSISKWNDYSSNATNNLQKVFELYDIIANKGNQYQLEEVTNIINTKIIPSIPSPSVFKKTILNKINSVNEEYKINCLDSIINTITEMVDYDRVLSNYNAISKRFNLDKVILNSNLDEDTITNTVHSLCSLIDTYDMNFKSKFTITAEAVLYGYNKYKSVSQNKLLEDVIDYYLISGGNNNTLQFLEDVEDAMNKDNFLKNSSKGYIRYLSNIYNSVVNEDNIIPEVEYHDINLYDMIPFTEFINSKSLFESVAPKQIQLYESDKDILTKFKLFPKKFNLLKFLREKFEEIFMYGKDDPYAKFKSDLYALSWICTIISTGEGLLIVVFPEYAGGLALLSLLFFVGQVVCSILFWGCVIGQKVGLLAKGKKDIKDHISKINKLIKTSNNQKNINYLTTYKNSLEYTMSNADDLIDNWKSLHNNLDKLGFDYKTDKLSDKKVLKEIFNFEFSKKTFVIISSILVVLFTMAFASGLFIFLIYTFGFASITVGLMILISKIIKFFDDLFTSITGKIKEIKDDKEKRATKKEFINTLNELKSKVSNYEKPKVSAFQTKEEFNKLKSGTLNILDKFKLEAESIM